MNVKKIIALVLAVVMLATLCVGCGKDEKVELDVMVAEYGPNTAAWYKQFEADFGYTGAVKFAIY